MSKRQFEVEIKQTVIIEIDDSVVNINDDPSGNINHIAYNMIVNQLDLNEIDGFADQPKENAKIVHESGWRIEVNDELEEINHV